jgi:hypothetical protein
VLGPVGPHQPILTTVGRKRVIAFYTPSSDNCDLQAVVWDNTDVNDTTAARVRVNLSPGQMVQIDTPEQRSLNLQCGDHGKTLVVVDHGPSATRKHLDIEESKLVTLPRHPVSLGYFQRRPRSAEREYSRCLSKMLPH